MKCRVNQKIADISYIVFEKSSALLSQRLQLIEMMSSIGTRISVAISPGLRFRGAARISDPRILVGTVNARVHKDVVTGLLIVVVAATRIALRRRHFRAAEWSNVADIHQGDRVLNPVQTLNQWNSVVIFHQRKTSCVLKVEDDLKKNIFVTLNVKVFWHAIRS